MTTNDVTIGIENAAAHLVETAARLTAAQRTYDAAKAARDALGYETAGVAAKVRLVILQAEAALEDASARLAEGQRVHAVARDEMWAPLLRRGYRDRHRTRLQAAESAAQTLAAGLAEDLADREALARTLGLADSGGHPHVDAVRLVQALAYYRRQLDPPPPAPLAPPRPGMTRLACTAQFLDIDAGCGIVRYPGDTFDARTEFVQELVGQLRVAEPVEAGAGPPQ